MGAKHKKQPKPNTQKSVPFPAGAPCDTVLAIKLNSCQTLHEQLQLLRKLGGDDNKIGITAGDDYRVLLQWMCSHDIPQNLRRVLTSTCSKIRSRLLCVEEGDISSKFLSR